MADALTNAQYALGLFQPIVNAFQQGNSQRIALAQSEAEKRRAEAIMFWKREQELADAAADRLFKSEQTDKQIKANLASQRETTERILQEQRATEKRQLEAEVRRLYSKYTDLTDDDVRKPLISFGKEPGEQFEALSRTVGELQNRVVLDSSVKKLYEDYGALGGKKPVNDFGKTDADKIQNLSVELGKLKADKAKMAYQNLGTEISSLNDRIKSAEQLTPEESLQAKNAGVMALGQKAREAFLRARAAGLSEETALNRVAKSFPEDVDAYRNEIVKNTVGLVMNKRNNDKTLRELYDNATILNQMRARAAMNLMEISPESLNSVTKPTAQAQAEGRVTESDLRATTLNRGNKPAAATRFEINDTGNNPPDVIPYPPRVSPPPPPPVSVTPPPAPVWASPVNSLGAKRQDSVKDFIRALRPQVLDNAIVWPNTTVDALSSRIRALQYPGQSDTKTDLYRALIQAATDRKQQIPEDIISQIVF